MNIEERLKLYEGLYYHELESRNKIESRLKLPFAVFAVVFSMLAFLFTETVFSQKVTVGPYFWVLYGGSVIALLFAIGFFVKAWYGYQYKLLPKAQGLEEYYGQILDSYKTDYPKKSEQWAQEAFKEYLLSTYSEYASHNSTNNDRKSEFVHRCIAALLVSFITACISYQPYYDAVSKKELLMSDSKTMDEKPAPPPPPPPRNVRGEEPRQKEPPKPKS